MAAIIPWIPAIAAAAGIGHSEYSRRRAKSERRRDQKRDRKAGGSAGTHSGGGALSGLSKKEAKKFEKEFRKYEKASAGERKKMAARYDKEYARYEDRYGRYEGDLGRYEKERSRYEKELKPFRKSRAKDLKRREKAFAFNDKQLQRYGKEKFLQHPALNKKQQGLLDYLSKYGQGVPKIPNIERSSLFQGAQGGLLGALQQLRGAPRTSDNPLYQKGAEGLMDLLSDNPKAIEKFIEPLLNRFHKDIVPAIAERFSGLGAGAQRSSAFPQAFAEAGKDLASELGAVRANLIPGAIGQAAGYAQLPGEETAQRAQLQSALAGNAGAYAPYPAQQALNEAQLRLGAGAHALNTNPYVNQFRPAAYQNIQEVGQPAAPGFPQAPGVPGVPEGLFGAPNAYAGRYAGGQYAPQAPPQRQPGALDYIGTPILQGIGSGLGSGLNSAISGGFNSLFGGRSGITGRSGIQVPGTTGPSSSFKLPSFQIPNRFGTGFRG